MAATIIGVISTNGYTVQSRRFVQARSGLVTLTEEWLCNLADVLTVFPSKGTAHGTFTDLFFQDYQAGSAPSGLLKATVTYEGASFAGGGTSTPPNYYMTTGTQSVSILKHPSVGTWITSEVAAGRDPRDAGKFFSAWKAGAVSSGAQSLYGAENYLQGTAVWNEEWVTSSAPTAADLAAIGTIITPGGSPPTPASTSWLCIENSWRELSPTRFARARSSLLSEANAGGGWNTDIY